MCQNISSTSRCRKSKTQWYITCIDIYVFTKQFSKQGKNTQQVH